MKDDRATVDAATLGFLNFVAMLANLLAFIGGFAGVVWIIILVAGGHLWLALGAVVSVYVSTVLTLGLARLCRATMALEWRTRRWVNGPEDGGMPAAPAGTEKVGTQTGNP